MSNLSTTDAFKATRTSCKVRFLQAQLLDQICCSYGEHLQLLNYHYIAKNAKQPVVVLVNFLHGLCMIGPVDQTGGKMCMAEHPQKKEIALACVSMLVPCPLRANSQHCAISGGVVLTSRAIAVCGHRRTGPPDRAGLAACTCYCRE